MTDDGNRDEQLTRLLKRWTAPAVPERLDERVLAAYRRRSLPLWRRLFQIELRVPLPVAAAVLLVLALAAGLAVRRPADEARAGAPSPTPAASEPHGTDLALVSHTSLTGFQPVDAPQTRVLSEGRP